MNGRTKGLAKGTPDRQGAATWRALHGCAVCGWWLRGAAAAGVLFGRRGHSSRTNDGRAHRTLHTQTHHKRARALTQPYYRKKDFGAKALVSEDLMREGVRNLTRIMAVAKKVRLCCCCVRAALRGLCCLLAGAAVAAAGALPTRPDTPPNKTTHAHKHKRSTTCRCA